MSPSPTDRSPSATARPAVPFPRRVAVIGGGRVPLARADGPYATRADQERLTAALNGLVDRHGLQEAGAVGGFVARAVLQHSRDVGLARETAPGPAPAPRPVRRVPAPYDEGAVTCPRARPS